MKKVLYSLLILIFILQSCNGSFVTKSVIDSQNYTFIHAGKQQNLLFELKEIRTFTRQNGIFTLNRQSGPVNRNVSYDYAIYASVSDGKSMIEIFEFPCNKDADLDDFLKELKIKRSKKRDHFAVAYKNETVGVFSTFKRESFLVHYPLEENGFEYSDFSKLNLTKLANAREDLLKHITGTKKLLISDKKLHDILMKIPASDELNYELSYSIAKEEIFENKTYQKSIIKHCSKDKNWQKNALKSLKNKKQELDTDQFISKLHAIGGMQEVVKEDEFQLKMFLSNGDLSYFSRRFEKSDILIAEKIKNDLKNNLLKKIKNPCKLSSNQLNTLSDYFKILEQLGEKNSFDVFFENYEKSTCLTSSLHDLNNEFLFPSPTIGESDKRKWIEFVVRNFKSIPSHNRSWDYSTLEGDLSCEQKRDLMTKYKKDIDVFDNKEIPVCN
ncbi:MAG: hypothetical protein V4622_13085 [Bacteroidota bacterium]